LDGEADSEPCEEVLSVGAGAAGGVATGWGGVAGCVEWVTSLVSSEVALRNSRMALPIAPPSSGKRPGPKTMSTTTTMAMIQKGCMGINRIIVRRL
jgi:hypothetical protein